MAIPVLLGGAILVASIAVLVYVVFTLTDWYEIIGISIAAVLMMMFMGNVLDLKIAV